MKYSYQNTYSPMIEKWLLEKDTLFLNHGSFGACPVAVLKKQDEHREMLERQPVRFMLRELDELLLVSVNKLAKFINCNTEDLAFVPNATHGVNTVLHSLKFNPGDEILITNHIYPACKNVIIHAAEISGAKVIEVPVKFPVETDNDFIEPILNGISKKTKLVLIDHITSSTAIIFPVGKIVSLLNEMGIDTLVDGAHAPGSIPLDLKQINPAYYTGNCHKWLCSPKGAAFLYVRDDKQDGVLPLSISHVYGKERKFRERFQWTGTDDFSAAICVGDSIDYMSTLFQGGWNEIMERNHLLVLQGRELLAETLGIKELSPAVYLSSMASLHIPDSSDYHMYGNNVVDSLQDTLFSEYHIEIPVIIWPKTPGRLIRISAQVYNSFTQYEILCDALKKISGMQIRQ